MVCYVFSLARYITLNSIFADSICRAVFVFNWSLLIDLLKMLDFREPVEIPYIFTVCLAIYLSIKE